MVCFFPKGATTSEISKHSEQAFAALSERGWHAALLRLDSEWFQRLHPQVQNDSEHTTVLRCCVMKPEHLSVVKDFVTAASSAATYERVSCG